MIVDLQLAPEGSRSTEPGPSRLAGPIKREEQVDLHRNLDCGRYDGCLDHAVEDGWEGWSCQPCPLFLDRQVARAKAASFADDRRRGWLLP